MEFEEIICPNCGSTLLAEDLRRNLRCSVCKVNFHQNRYVGFGFFYLTSVPYVLDSSVLTAIAAISYLMCIEGVLLKALPGGGNELVESLKDSKGIYKIFPFLSFLLGLWLFIRILIVSPDSEFANLQQDLLSMGSFSLTFALMLAGYALIIIIIGFFIKVKNRDTVKNSFLY